MSYFDTIDKIKSTTYDTDTETPTPQIFTRGDALTWRFPEELDPVDEDIEARD